jgi:putative PEP-CTERM system histidine kinase
MMLAPFLNLASAVVCFGFVLGGLIFKPRRMIQWSFILGMAVLGCESVCHVLSLDAGSPNDLVFWESLSLVAKSFLPAVWLVYALGFSRGNAAEFLKKWTPGILLLGVAPPVFALAFRSGLISEVAAVAPAGNWVFRMAWPGRVLHVAMILGAVLILMNLEWTFRAAVGRSRWKIKYTVIGLALLFGARIYTSSQAILYSAGSVQLNQLNSAALLLACLLVAFSFWRSKLSHIDIYPSASALHRSFSVVLAGVYLAAVGLMAKIVTALGGDNTFEVKSLLVLLACVGFCIICMSDRLRQATKRFISTHFRRPMYDYRKVWMTFSERTTALLDRHEFCRSVSKLVSETFEVLSVTIWLADSATSKLTRFASTSLESDGAPESMDASDLLRQLAAYSQPFRPVNIDLSSEKWCETVRQANPMRFVKGGHRFCMPIAASGEVLGLLVLGDRVNGIPFTPEDLELLKCLGEQIGAALHNLDLAEKLVQNKELAAFQAMSAFLVHDLKNTASTLTLMLRNMTAHFENPAFREDALRGLSKSVDHLDDLIGRLTALRHKLEVSKAPADLNQVVHAALGTLGPTPGIQVRESCQPIPAFSMDAKQVENVVANLLLNAKEATSSNGEIRIETARDNGWALLSVSDNGCGMTPEFMERSLFKPFKTTKKKGLGIGMFQAKTIVEAHGGRIEVQSAQGRGTTFRIWLPITDAVAQNS